MLLEVDANATTDGERNTLVSNYPFSLDPTVGMELNYGRFIFFRCGVNNLQQEKDMFLQEQWTAQPNVGLGLKLGNLNIDYALTDVGAQEEKTYAHVISIGLKLDFNYLKKAIKAAEN